MQNGDIAGYIILITMELIINLTEERPKHKLKFLKIKISTQV